MKSNVAAFWSALAIGIAAVSLYSVIIVQGSDTKPVLVLGSQAPHNVQVPKKPEIRPGMPIRLSIPRIKVDAAVEPVGLTPFGAMAVPEGPAGVAWFDLGPRPGEAGNAVIAGHEGWKNGIAAVFDNLHKLAKGDMIYVEDGAGTTTAFVVRETRIYGQNEDASAVFASSDGKAHLNLITCEGIWNKADKSYSGRLVIFADRLSTVGNVTNL